MSESPFAVYGPIVGKEAPTVCEQILRALPEWFGMPEAVAQYVRDAATLPTWVAVYQRQEAGFLLLKQHTPYAAEIYAMGVLPEFHRRGIGRALSNAAEAWLRAASVEYLQVKTLGPSHPDAN